MRARHSAATERARSIRAHAGIWAGRADAQPVAARLQLHASWAAPAPADRLGAAQGGPAAEQSSPREPPTGATAITEDDVAVRFVDDAVLSALSLVNMDLRQEYRQAVLLGCGLDSRPFRCSLYVLDCTLHCPWCCCRLWHGLALWWVVH